MYKKIVMVGAGNVGATALYSLIMNHMAKEYIIIEPNENLAHGQFMDLQDAMQTENIDSTIKVGQYQDAQDADVVVINAGRGQRIGESRDGLLLDNTKIIRTIIESLNKVNYQGLILIASNPVDIMARVAIKYSNLPKEKIIGTGTLLDTYRLRIVTNDRNSIVVGEHGDSSVAIFDQEKAKNLKCAEANSFVRERAGKIIKDKGYTAFGIATAITDILKTLSLNTSSDKPIAIPLSIYHDYNDLDICASVPTYANKNGIVASKKYSDLFENNSDFKNSVLKIKDNWNRISKLLNS